MNFQKLWNALPKDPTTTTTHSRCPSKTPLSSWWWGQGWRVPSSWGSPLSPPHWWYRVWLPGEQAGSWTRGSSSFAGGNDARIWSGSLYKAGFKVQMLLTVNHMQCRNKLYPSSVHGGMVIYMYTAHEERKLDSKAGFRVQALTADHYSAGIHSPSSIIRGWWYKKISAHEEGNLFQKQGLKFQLLFTVDHMQHRPPHGGTVIHVPLLEEGTIWFAWQEIPSQKTRTELKRDTFT